jgi:asparagine synthase (glutamine-hydrolysing)
VCGICGIVGRERVELDVLARMTATLTHRGPDDDGYFIRDYGSRTAVGLGFRRLSIIDLASGNQPIGNEDGSVKLVVNGEIYNYRELRADLAARGHRFSSNADTEVVAHLYEDYGSQCVELLNGMFALAIWDEHRRELLLARDRFGKKPLYYAEVGETMLFGSEPKALLEHPLCPRRLDHVSLSRYLALEYVPTPASIFDGIAKLPAGHTLRWHDGRTTVSRYWDLTFSPDAPERSADDYADELRSLLGRAVRRRLVSDVPLGAFLSGGIDSSSVVAMMASEVPAGALKTFSIGFSDRSFDESRHARRVAERFGADHHEEVFTPSVMLDTLPIVVEFLDEPFADPSILPTYLLSSFAREYVTVVLGGDGADELLAGYPTFAAERMATLYHPPRAIHENVVVPLADRLPISRRNFSFDFKVKRFLRGARCPAAIRHPIWLGAFSHAEQRAVLQDEPDDPLSVPSAAYANAPTTDPLSRLIYAYSKTYLQDDILVKVDRASMANSLEVRAPFLDVELVDFLGRVPSGLKLRRLDTKHLLKHAMRNWLPSGIASRRKKGFGIPVSRWLRGPLRELVEDELAADRLERQGLFVPDEVQRLVRDHMDGRRDHRKQLWTLLQFQLWHRRWLEGGGARPRRDARAVPQLGLVDQART